MSLSHPFRIILRVLKIILRVRFSAFVLWTIAALPTAVAPDVSVLMSPYSAMLQNATDSGFGFFAQSGLWVILGATSVTFAIPGALPLTIIRTVIPANLLISVWFAASTHENSLADHGFHLGAGLAATIAVLVPVFADAMIDAASYGDERRYLLRPPGPALIASVIPMWMLSVTAPTAGPLLLINQHWVLGITASLVGAPVTVIAWLSLYRLSRRWVVFVPGGLVIHDHMTTAQPMSLARRNIESIGPAPAKTGAVDLTKQAFGLALELRFKTPLALMVETGHSTVKVQVRQPSNPDGRTKATNQQAQPKRTNRERTQPEQGVSAMLISPSRPASVLSTAEKRGIKIS